MIWVDLDHTLLCAVYAYPGFNRLRLPCWRRWRGVQIGEQGYLVRLRPQAIKFLAALRRLDRCKMLTLANRDYALRMNREFGLGFVPRDIVAADVFAIRALRVGWRSVDPRGVLVQAKGSHTDQDAYQRGYLGVTDRRCVLVKKYEGKAERGTLWRKWLAEVEVDPIG